MICKINVEIRSNARTPVEMPKSPNAGVEVLGSAVMCAAITIIVHSNAYAAKYSVFGLVQCHYLLFLSAKAFSCFATSSFLFNIQSLLAISSMPERDLL